MLPQTHSSVDRSPYCHSFFMTLPLPLCGTTRFELILVRIIHNTFIFPSKYVHFWQWTLAPGWRVYNEACICYKTMCICCIPWVFVLWREGMWRSLRTQKSDGILVDIWQRESDLLSIFCAVKDIQISYTEDHTEVVFWGRTTGFASEEPRINPISFQYGLWGEGTRSLDLS